MTTPSTPRPQRRRLPQPSNPRGAASSGPRMGWMVVALVAGASATLPAQPGYRGTLPSDEGKTALRQLVKMSPLRGRASVFGGARFELEHGGVTPHALGPARGDVIELRTTETKGPNVVLRRGKLGLFFPTRCDGDVLALYKLLEVAPPAGLEGDPSPEFGRALAATRGLGTAVDGIQIGLAPGPRPRTYQLTMWNIGDAPREWVGTAELHTNGAVHAVQFHWPDRLKPPVDGFRFSLDAASSLRAPFALPAPQKDPAPAPGDPPSDPKPDPKPGGEPLIAPLIPKGDHRAVFVLRPLGREDEARELRSAILGGSR